MDDVNEWSPVLTPSALQSVSVELGDGFVRTLSSGWRLTLSLTIATQYPQRGITPMRMS